MRHLMFCLSALIAAFALALPGPASAQLKIDITEGNIDPLPIAVTDFEGNSDEALLLGESISQVVRTNLERSGLFAPIDPAAFPEQAPNPDYEPTYQNWRVINADALVVGRVIVESETRVVIQFRLWDTVQREEMVRLQLGTTPDNWRRVAHKISDMIYEAMTGESGYFDSRIVFVSETGPKERRVKRLAIMDQDGANQEYLTSGDYLVLTPRFSPNSQTITYLSYETGRPQVYLYNIETGQREILGNFPGMTFAPRFSPDGEKVVMALSRAGNTDIYVMNLSTRQMDRLTSDPGIDTSPSFSPDGRRITFNSDRGGSPQIYIMNADGSNVRRVSQEGGNYTAPVWSPRGDWIAFTKVQNGQFHIGVLSPDGRRSERLLTESFLDEGPTWAPNGRAIMFMREGRGVDSRPSLWSVDLSGRNLRRVVTIGGASDPAWGPLLD